MTTLELISGLQIVSLILSAIILYLIGFFHGMHWKKRNGV